MKLEILTLCHSADENKSNGIDIIAASDRVYSDIAPGKISRCVLFYRLRFDATEAGNHNVSISLIGDDGKSLMPPNKKQITAKLKNDYSTCTNLGMVGINGVLLPKFGEYSLDFFVDGVAIGSQPLYFEQTVLK
jgi:hypothetical protein